jgi:hypothetical protein
MRETLCLSSHGDLQGVRPECLFSFSVTGENETFPAVPCPGDEDPAWNTDMALNYSSETDY